MKHNPVLLFHNCLSSSWLAEASDLADKRAVTHHLPPKTPCYSHTVSQDLHSQEKLFKTVQEKCCKSKNEDLKKGL